MDIVRVNDSDKRRHMDLLLMADEQENMIERYLERGEMYALYDNDLRALCIVTDEGKEIFEIKNIVVKPEYRRMGYGRRLIEYILGLYQLWGTVMLVGTGDVPSVLHFYERCGFIPSHIVKNFFTEYYDHPLFDEGRQLVDMIYLKKML